jgi:hypothetical protein
LAYLDLNLPLQDLESRLDLLESLLDVLANIKPAFTSISSSIIALIKAQILNEISLSTMGAEDQLLTSLDHHVFQQDSVIQPDDFIMQSGELIVDSNGIPTLVGFLDDMWAETRMNILAEFLEHCSSSGLPYRAAETLEKINRSNTIPGEAAIHHTHQYRFANSIRGVFDAGVTHLISQIVNLDCWNLYAETEKPNEEGQNLADAAWIPWLDDVSAQDKIKEAFGDYAAQLTASAESPDFLNRIRRILQGIDLWHPEPGLIFTVALSDADADDQPMSDEGSIDWRASSDETELIFRVTPSDADGEGDRPVSNDGSTDSSWRIPADETDSRSDSRSPDEDA